MSRKPKGVDIPWILIVFLFLSGAWPIGLLLLILRELPIGKTSTQTSASAASQSTSSKTTSAKKKKEKTSQLTPPRTVTSCQFFQLLL